MRAIINIARLHILLSLQDRAVYIQEFVIPVILMVVLSLALNEESFDFRILVDVVDEDQTALSESFIETLKSAAGDETVYICVYGADNISEKCDLSTEDSFEDVGEQRLEDIVTSAAIIIPAGFGAKIENGESPAIEYRSDEQLNIQTVTRTAVDSAITQFNSSLAIASEGVRGVEAYFGGFADDAERQTDFNQLREDAQIALEIPPAVVNTESSGEEEVVGFGASQTVPGMSSMFVLFSLLGLSQFMIEERRQGTMQRLFTVPTRRINIVVGKIMGAFMFGFLQFLVFLVVGVVLGVNWGDDIIAVLALIFAFCMAGTALGFLLSTLVRTAEQAGAMITLMGLVLAPLGGAWWPLSIVPDFMRVIGHVSPIAWAMDGFTELLHYNGTFIDIMPEIGALIGFAILFTLIAAWNFRYE